MISDKKTENGILTVCLNEKLDASTVPQTEKELKPAIADARQLVLDAKNLDYVSSAGLRLIFMLNKK